MVRLRVVERISLTGSSSRDGTRLSDYDNASTVPLPGETHETGRFARWFRSKLLPVLNTVSAN